MNSAKSYPPRKFAESEKTIAAFAEAAEREFPGRGRKIAEYFTRFRTPNRWSVSDCIEWAAVRLGYIEVQP